MPIALSDLVQDDPARQSFRVHRDLFRDPALFELEMKHIFEGSWVFLGLEAQIPKPNDFLTTHIGRQPVAVMRDAKGAVRAFLNSCRHRGSVLCHLGQGNRRVHVCSYHGWAYDSGGRNVLITSQDGACAGAAFEKDSHDLVPVARFGSYRGFMFGSLSVDVPALEDHLGGARAFIDLLIDQSPDGLEIIPSGLRFTFEGNWKTQVENGTDTYHFAPTHASYIGILERGRKAGGSSYAEIDKRGKLARGTFNFENGHSVIWGPVPSPEARPVHASIAEITSRVGETRAKWMLYMRNLSIFPNLQLADNVALQLRVIRPLAVDRTEITAYCIGPRGEGAAARRLRIRQYEDFFNPSGLATPDDTAAYENCQAGYAARAIEWQQGYVRGISVVRPGGNEHADELGISPTGSVYGPVELADETSHHALYREWMRLVAGGVARETQRA